MTKLKILGSAGRFGVRYGQSVKRRIADIESKQRKKQACPLCGGRAVRLSKGIWKCKRCEKKFAGHAYFLELQTPKQQQENFISTPSTSQKNKAEKNLNSEKPLVSEEKSSKVKKSKTKKTPEKSE